MMIAHVVVTIATHDADVVLRGVPSGRPEGNPKRPYSKQRMKVSILTEQSLRRLRVNLD